MYTINQFVHQNLIYSCSQLIFTLTTAEAQLSRSTLEPSAYLDLLSQAEELSYPMQDYDEAARSIGYYESNGGWAHDSMTPAWIQTAEAVCETQCIEPYVWEVTEYWVVTSCLAHRLQLAGEHVDRDFAGFEVWARCSKGPLHLDPVIVSIFRTLTTARAGE